MGIAELTAKIESLSEEDYNMVSEDALVEQLAESIRKSDMGATKSAREVSKSMRKLFITKGAYNL